DLFYGRYPQWKSRLRERRAMRSEYKLPSSASSRSFSIDLIPSPRDKILLTRSLNEAINMKKTIAHTFALSVCILLAFSINALGLSLSVPDNPLWTDTGITLSSGNQLSISASGTWDFGIGSYGPTGSLSDPAPYD